MKKRNFVEQNKRQFNSRYPKSMPTSRQSSEPKTNQYFASSRDSLATSRQTSQKPQSYSKQITSPQNSQKVNAPKKVDIKLVDFVKAQESVQSNDQQIPYQPQNIQLQLHDQQPFVEKTMKISVLEQNCGQVMEEQLEFSFSNLYSEKKEKTIEEQESTKNQQKDNQVESQKKPAKVNQNGQKPQQAVAQLHQANNRDNQTKSNCYYQINQMKQAIKQRQNSYNLQLQAKLGGNHDLLKQKNNQKQANQRKQASPSPLQSPRSIQQQPSNNQKLEKSPKSDKQVKTIMRLNKRHREKVRLLLGTLKVLPQHQYPEKNLQHPQQTLCQRARSLNFQKWYLTNLSKGRHHHQGFNQNLLRITSENQIPYMPVYHVGSKKTDLMARSKRRNIQHLKVTSRIQSKQLRSQSRAITSRLSNKEQLNPRE